MAKRGMMKSTYRRMARPITVEDVIKDALAFAAKPDAKTAWTLAVEKAGGRVVRL